MNWSKINNFTYSDLQAELYKLKSKEMKTNFFMKEVYFNKLLFENKIEFFKLNNACFLLCDDIHFKRLYFIISFPCDLEAFFEYLKKTINLFQFSNMSFMTIISLLDY
jgi:hypothetical protein